MSHPDDGTLQALLDGELDEAARAEWQAHVADCPRCTTRLKKLEAERALVSSALETLDVAPRADRARAAVLSRVRGPVRSVPGARHSWWRTDLARAAGLVLVFAAAASAMVPGSPVRSWLSDVFTDDAAPAPVEDGLPEASLGERTSAPSEVGVQLRSTSDLRVSLVELNPGAEVVVRLVEGLGSGVFAPEGAEFQTSQGRVEASVPGSWVRIELSRAVSSAVIDVEGDPWLTKTGDRLRLAGPHTDSTDTEIRFRVSGAGR